MDIITMLEDAKPGIKYQIMYDQNGISFPITLIVGNTQGKTLLLSAGVHGCEYASIQCAQELGREIMPESVSGTIIIVHIANLSGFENRLPELVAEDRKNLNRVFPGNPAGSMAERLAYSLTLMQEKSDFYVDMHGGDLHESMYPFVFVPGVAEEHVVAAASKAAQVLSVPVRVRSKATSGAYNSAAINGTPSMLIERGGNGRWFREEVEAYKRDIYAIMAHLGIMSLPEGATERQQEQREITAPVYLEATVGGCWYPAVSPGDSVCSGEILGEIRNVFGEVQHTYCAEKDGIVLYMTVSLAVSDGVPLVAYG